MLTGCPLSPYRRKAAEMTYNKRLIVSRFLVRKERSHSWDRSACKRLRGPTGVTKVLAAVVACLAYLAIAVPTAPADPDSPFTPKLENFEVSTTQAGANPDLTFHVTQPLANCAEPPNPSPSNPCSKLDLQQSLKKLELQMPAGLMADAQAAPYCDAQLIDADPSGTWGLPPEVTVCKNEEARIGTVTLIASICEIALQQIDGCLQGSEEFPGFPLPDNAYYHLPGTVYNEKPEPGEQGRLVIIWPTNEFLVPIIGEEIYKTLPPGFINGYIRSDVSVTVEGPDLRIKAVADKIPDRLFLGANPVAQSKDGYFPGQLFDLTMTLKGDTGLDDGHPLLANSTFCNPQSFEIGLQGYAFNAFFDFATGATSNGFEVPNGHGDGKTFSFSPPYQPTGCEKLPYNPTFSAAANPTTAGAAPALTTNITQQDDEATTKKVQVDFPKGTGVNINTTLQPCDSTALSDKCKMGAATADSRLLPAGESLSGGVFLTGFQGNKLALTMRLKGFIDLTIDGTAGISQDGSLTASFDNLPSVPLSAFTLALDGGVKSLINNSKDCGTSTTKATFTSHSGKTHQAKAPIEISGCVEATGLPTFEASLSAERPGERTNLELEVQSDKKQIKELKFGIDRHIKLSPNSLGNKRRLGSMEVKSDKGTNDSGLLRPKKGKKVASVKKGKALKLLTGVDVLGAASINIYRERFKRIKAKSFKKAKNKKTKALKKKTVPKNRISVTHLPAEDNVERVSLELNPDELSFIKTPTGCKRALKFLAIVKTTDGKKYHLTQKVKLKGKGCAGSKKKK